jgi:uncharacterized phage infection (PIP) family protein YhgE
MNSSAHFFLNWVKERIDEMDAALASLESEAGQMRADARMKAEQFIVDLRQKRDEFERSAKKQAEAGEAAWDAAKAQLDSEWKGFEAEMKKYLEAVAKDVGQLQTVFQSQGKAQINALRQTADKIHAAAAQFAAERRKDVDASVSRMRAEATAAEEKLRKLAEAKTESWPALSAALTETRAVFDRTNQAAREAFKQAVRQ